MPRPSRIEAAESAVVAAWLPGTEGAGVAPGQDAHEYFPSVEVVQFDGLEREHATGFADDQPRTRLPSEPAAGYGGPPAIEGVSFELAAGEHAAFLRQIPSPPSNVRSVMVRFAKAN